jgi:3-keto-disaccharide hydrolase
LFLAAIAGVTAYGQTNSFDLTAWKVVGDANWTVVDDVIQADTGTGFLVTPTTHGDFQITVDIWVNDEANSGVFIRCSDPKTITAANAYELNIFDKRSDPAYRTGATRENERMSSRTRPLFRCT